MNTDTRRSSLTYPDGLLDDVAPLGEKIAHVFLVVAIITALAGSVLVIGAFLNPRQFFHSYLFGYVFALDITLGALFWVLIHHVSDAGWSVGLRRVFENMTNALIPLIFLFFPVLVGIFSGQLHIWYEFIHQPEPEYGSHEAHQWHIKRVYFAMPFFLFRLAVYFAVWIAYASAMSRWSLRQDSEGGAVLTQKMQWWSPSGILLLGLTTSFFAFDVLMSLQFTWFSTIFGVYFWTGGIRGSLSACALIVLALRYCGFIRNTVTIEHLHDVGKLMFGFTVFWAYIAFTQYFLIWYGNMPEESQFYLLRRNGSWYTLSVLLPILYFAVPFILLLPREHKRNSMILAVAAAWILVIHIYDLYWQVMPVLHPDSVHLSALDIAAPIAFFGILVLVVIRGIQLTPLIPLRDPRLCDSIGYQNDSP